MRKQWTINKRRYLQVGIMFYAGGLSTAQIAEKIGRTEAAVYNSLHYAKMAYREECGDVGLVKPLMAHECHA